MRRAWGQRAPSDAVSSAGRGEEPAREAAARAGASKLQTKWFISRVRARLHGDAERRPSHVAQLAPSASASASASASRRRAARKMLARSRTVRAIRIQWNVTHDSEGRVPGRCRCAELGAAGHAGGEGRAERLMESCHGQTKIDGA